MSPYLMRILIALSTLIDSSFGQIDLNLCPNGPTPPGNDVRWPSIPTRFEIATELVTSIDMGELLQTFSTQRDAIVFAASPTPIQMYWDFVTNEQFEVLPFGSGEQPISLCIRQQIEPTSKTSVIIPNVPIIKPSVLLGFDARNQPNSIWGIRYDGDEELRGIFAYRFKSCFYVPDIQATVSATYYVSDPEKSQTYLSKNTSTLLQIKLNISTDLTDSFTYNIFHYTPNPSSHEQRLSLQTPTGVYCPNRTSTLVFPQNLPSIVSQNMESLVPQLNSSIFTGYMLYDTQQQLSYYDTWYPSLNGQSSLPHMSIIHDFATGLSYEYNTATGQCFVYDLAIGGNDGTIVNGKPNLIQMGSMQHLFQSDNISYQYTGEKPCRDQVWCHLWIGERSWLNSTLEHYEWYWASRINDHVLTRWIPIKLITRVYQNYNLIRAIESNIFNFRDESDSFVHIGNTLAKCYRSVGLEQNFNLGVVFFALANDQNYPVQQNIDYLRYTVRQTLTTVLHIRSIRLSHIIIDRDANDILVTLTLLDAPPRTGSVEFPLQEASFVNVIEDLRAVIDANILVFRAKYDNVEVNLRARVNSLRVIAMSADGNNNGCINQTLVRSVTVNQCPESTMDPNLVQPIETVYKSSGPLITGLYIGFIILGLLCGTIGGFFTLKRVSK